MARRGRREPAAAAEPRPRCPMLDAGPPKGARRGRSVLRDDRAAGAASGRTAVTWAKLPRMSGDKGKQVMRMMGVGCGCTGLVIALFGFGAAALIVLDQVSRSDRDEWMAASGGLCCVAVFVLLFGVALFFLGRKKADGGGAPGR